MTSALKVTGTGSWTCAATLCAAGLGVGARIGGASASCGAGGGAIGTDCTFLTGGAEGGVSPGGRAADLSTAVSLAGSEALGGAACGVAAAGLGCRRHVRGSGLLRRCLEDHRHGAGHARRERAKRGRRGTFFRRHGLRRGVRRAGDRIEYRGEPLFQLARIGRGDEGAAGDAGKAGERLELIGLAAVTDHMDAQRLRLLLHRRGRRADVGVARVAAVGDEDDVEALIFDLRLGGVAQGGGDRRLSLRLDLVEQLVLGGEGQLAGLGQSLAVGAVRCLAMAEGHQPERQPARISAERGAELRLRGGDLGRIADLGVHAARRVEHDDGGGQAGDGRGRILGCGRRRPKQSGGQKHGAKPRAAFPPHGDSSDNPAASCYTRFRCATMG